MCIDRREHFRIRSLDLSSLLFSSFRSSSSSQEHLASGSIAVFPSLVGHPVDRPRNSQATSKPHGHLPDVFPRSWSSLLFSEAVSTYLCIALHYRGKRWHRVSEVLVCNAASQCCKTGTSSDIAALFRLGVDGFMYR